MSSSDAPQCNGECVNPGNCATCPNRGICQPSDPPTSEEPLDASQATIDALVDLTHKFDQVTADLKATDRALDGLRIQMVGGFAELRSQIASGFTTVERSITTLARNDRRHDIEQASLQQTVGGLVRRYGLSATILTAAGILGGFLAKAWIHWVSLP